MNRKKSAKSLSKPLPISAIQKPTLDRDIEMQAELEICWCVHQLQTALEGGQLSQKAAEDTAKNLKVLTSKTAPLIRKRQVMQQAFGDYRSKMQQEEKKMQLAPKSIKFLPPPSAEDQKKSSFVRKSALLTSGKDFRFNFPHIDNNDSGAAAGPPAENKVLPTAPATNNALSLANALNTNKGNGFKFNFVIDVDDDIGMNGLKLGA